MQTADTITDKQIRDLRSTVMNGSPLAESCDIALGDMVLDGTDAEVELEVARERIAKVLNGRNRLSKEKQ
jgi:hypothetical protein